MLGETMTRPMEAMVPTSRPEMTPAVLNFFQKSDITTTGRLPEEATAKARATRWATFCFSAARPMTDTDCADAERGDAGSHDLLVLVGMAVLDHVDVDVVGNGGGGCQNQAGNNRQDGGEGDRAEEGQEQVANDRGDVRAQLLGQKQGSHVAAGVNRGDSLGGDVDGGAEAQEGGHDIEQADDPHGDDNGLPGGLGGRNGEEAHQDVRHAGGAEHEGESQGDLVKGRLHEEGRLKETLAGLRAGQDHAVPQHQLGDMVLDVGAVDDVGEEGNRVEAGLGQNQHRQEGRAGHEQAGLDDLDPGGGLHAAEHDVADHQDADADDGGLVGDADQKRHQLAGADHLGGQVEGGDGNRRDGGHGADRLRIGAEGEDITQGVLAGVAARLGHDQEHGDVGHQPADRVHEPVIPVQGDHPGNPQERGGGHVVAGNGPAVLGAGDAAAGGVEVGGRLRVLGGPDNDAQR